MASEHTRSGARRSGDDYQDIIALEMFAEMLMHPSRYKWAKVEANEAGYLDDVVVLREDLKYIVKQVKFTVADKKISWKCLINRKSGEKGPLSSNLQKWNSSIKKLGGFENIHEASLITNRKLDDELKKVISNQNYIDFDKITDRDIVVELIEQFGSEKQAKIFFNNFKFVHDYPDINDLETLIINKFLSKIGINEDGYLNLKEELRAWVRKKKEPKPLGFITIEEIKKASLWTQLETLNQDFFVPDDYVLPSKDFHKDLKKELYSLKKGCLVVTGSPGIGKSTYLSYLFNEIKSENYPIIRHHYFLSTLEKPFPRFKHEKVIESLMQDILNNYSESLGNIETKNPNINNFYKWLEKSGEYFEKENKTLIITLDGLDHVLRLGKYKKELELLFEQLLPAPNGIIVLIGTQKLDETHLPKNLFNSAPTEEWRELSLLDQNAVQIWLSAQDAKINGDLIETAEAFFTKSGGHPLHLRYSLKALLEQEIQINKNNIMELPGISHNEINEYYKELWAMLEENEHEILYLFASCDFVWPIECIVDCFELQGRGIGKIIRSIKRVKHLLEEKNLGLVPFHSSIAVFIKNQDEYELYSKHIKNYALEWLNQKAPEYWENSFKWLLESELGDINPLVNGLTREWIINQLSNYFPKKELLSLFEECSSILIENGDISKFIEIRILSDYFNFLFNDTREIYDRIIYQFINDIDLIIEKRMLEDIKDFSPEGIAFLLEIQAYNDNCQIEPLLNEVNEKFISNLSYFDYADTFISKIEPFLKSASLYEDINVDNLVKYARNFQDINIKYPRIFLELFSRYLRVNYKLDHTKSTLNKLLDRYLNSLESSGVLKNLILLACEQGFSIYEIINEYPYDPFVAIYAFLDDVADFEIKNILFPNRKIFLLEENHQLLQEKVIGNAFYTTFFSFVANHLWQKSERNEEWLSRFDIDSWPIKFLIKLNLIANEFAKYLNSGKFPSFKWIYEQLKSFEAPEWPKDRSIHKYLFGANRALNDIGMDIIVLSNKLDKIAINPEDLETLLESDYCYPRKWISDYTKYRRKFMNDEAVSWILENQEEELSKSIEPFYDRASHFSNLLALTVIHNLETKSEEYSMEAVSNLLAYGYHKDILLDNVLNVIEICNEFGLTEVKPNLSKITPAIIFVMKYTDGDETNHLDEYLRNLVSKIDDPIPSKTMNSKKYADLELDDYSGIPNHIDFPPGELSDFIRNIKSDQYMAEEYAINQWINYWESEGKIEEIIENFEKEENAGRKLGHYDKIFDLALSVYGKEKAYNWLVKAQINEHGWHRYWTHEEEALNRFEIIKNHYPDKWLDFIQDSFKTELGLGMVFYISRLVKYCLIMNQNELAIEILEKIVNCTLQLVSPLNLPND